MAVTSTTDRNTEAGTSKDTRTWWLRPARPKEDLLALRVKAASGAARIVAAAGACGLLTVLLGCRRLAAASDDDLTSEARRRADAVSEQLPKRLMAELSAAMQERGPVAALQVCANIAQPLTREVGETQGLVVRRTSERYRNPANAPDDSSVPGSSGPPGP